MIDLLSKWRKRAPDRAPSSTGGRLIYAIGDVHGRLDLLDRLLEQICDDATATNPAEPPVLIFLGDYVDRGPQSRGVIERVLQLKNLSSFEVRALKGNHEQTLVSFISDPQVGQSWIANGGAAALASYGVLAPLPVSDAQIWIDARDAFVQVLPARHLEFLKTLELRADYGDYVFVHAGLRPGVALDEQTEQDMLWIRAEFLYERKPFEKVVVHGHTPESDPVLNDVRIGVDTGAYATGVLTAARLHGAERGILQARTVAVSDADL